MSLWEWGPARSDRRGLGSPAETWIVPTCTPSSREARVHMLVYIPAHLDASAHVPR